MQETIDSIIQLQNIDSARDAIATQKGDLPKQIAMLEQKLKNLDQQVHDCEEEVKEQKKQITEYKEASKKATALIADYKQENLGVNQVNDQESYDTMNREIALQELEIKLAKKRIKTCQERIVKEKDRIAEFVKIIEDNKQTIKLKKEALMDINEKNKDGEKELDTQRKKITNRLMGSKLLEKYESLRQKFSLGVAHIVEEACSGCFIVIPSQRQIRIREGKKIFICENCDRLLLKA